MEFVSSYASARLCPVLCITLICWKTSWRHAKNDKGLNYSNLNYEERSALKESEKNPEITLRPADKGGAEVEGAQGELMDFVSYNKFPEIHL